MLGGMQAALLGMQHGGQSGPVFLDTFTGNDATPLGSHIPDQSLNGWVETTNRWYILANKAYIGNSLSTTAYSLSYTNRPTKLNFDLTASGQSVTVYFNATTSVLTTAWAFQMNFVTTPMYRLYESGVLRSSYIVTPTSPSSVEINIVDGIFKITINGVYRPTLDYPFNDKGGGYIGLNGRSGKSVDNLRIEYAP